MPAIWTATALFIAAYCLVFGSRLHRTFSAMVGAVAMVIVGREMGFYSPEAAIEYIDFETIALLAGMMVHVALLSETGCFRFLSIKTAKLTGGSPWKLAATLALVTAFVSMIIDNVTTVVFIGPVTVLIADVLRINPVPALLAEAIMSNVGGVGTLVGDPPNIMIAHAAGLHFNDFLTHLFPVVLVVMIACLFGLRLLFRRQMREKSQHLETVRAMRERDAIRDMRALRLSLAGLGVTLALFLLGEPLGIAPSVAAMAGAVVSLVLIRPDPDKVFREVDWTVLIFFASLFVLVGGLDGSGVLDKVAAWTSGFGRNHPGGASVAVLWLGAVSSALIGNIPTAAALIPVVSRMGGLGIPVGPMWWALALGVGLGGNATPFGGAANVVAISISEKTKHKITYGQWMRIGLPVALISCLLATAAVLVLPW